MMLIVHEVLCFALFYSVFCRAVKMDRTTRPEIRASLQVMGTVAALGIAAPVHWRGWEPDYFDLCLLASITLVQLVTAYYWKDGVPSRFRHDYTGPERRLTERREIP